MSPVPARIVAAQVPLLSTSATFSNLAAGSWRQPSQAESAYRLAADVPIIGGTESARFIEIGVPATWFWAPDDPYYHSVHDSADKINPNSLKSVSDVSAVVMWRLANQ